MEEEKQEGVERVEFPFSFGNYNGKEEKEEEEGKKKGGRRRMGRRRTRKKGEIGTPSVVKRGRRWRRGKEVTF